MKNEMYWVPTDPKLAENTLIYVISHDSEDAAKKSWDGFRTTPMAQSPRCLGSRWENRAESRFCVMKKTDYSK